MSEALIREESSERARQLLPRNAYDYFAGSAGDERTYYRNLKAFRAILFRPRCLIPVSKVDTSVTLPTFGNLSAPIIVAPMAMQRMAHPDGEIAVARAAKQQGLSIVLSTFSTVSMEEVAQVGTNRLFQLYLYRNRAVSLSLIERARKSGYKGIVLTVDAPRYGRRQRDKDNAFHLPPHLTLANFSPSSTEDAISKSRKRLSALNLMGDLHFEQNLSPEILTWLVRTAKLPVWVKGILRGDDALIAVRAGAAGIIVSNHGARQLEGTIPSIQALPEVVEAVNGRVPVLLDSGVRTGEDVVKGCALGADAVLVGRPVLWALAEGGEKGVHDLLNEMKRTVDLTMALCGAPNTSRITKCMIKVPPEFRPVRGSKL